MWTRYEPRERRWAAALSLVLVLFSARSTLAGGPRSDPGHVPEPMQFDLVRGLGAHAGELEGNVLLIVPTSNQARGIEWAPEIEWAPVDDFAIELELPMLDHHSEAAKLSAQLTFPRPRIGRIRYGVQLTARLPFVSVPHGHLVHVIAARVGSRVGLVAMIGPRLVFADPLELELIVNGALFVSLPGGHAVGIETNWVGGRELGILPQLHVGLGEHARLQLGVGVRRSNATDRWRGEVGLRVIVER